VVLAKAPAGAGSAWPPQEVVVGGKARSLCAGQRPWGGGGSEVPTVLQVTLCAWAQMLPACVPAAFSAACEHSELADLGALHGQEMWMHFYMLNKARAKKVRESVN